jgi:hypothetical protein
MAGYLGSEAAFVSVAIADIEGDLNVGVDATVEGDLTVGGDTTVDGNLTVDVDATIEGNLTVSGLVPDVDATVDLGSPTKSFGDLYVNNIISPNMINNPNLLINPSFTVFQRAGTTLSGDWGVDHDIPTNPGGSFGPDGWLLRTLPAVGGTMLESTTDFSSGVNKMVVKHEGATSHAYTIQRIEAVNLLGLYGKEMTFSFSYSDVGGLGAPSVWIRSWDSSGTTKALFDAVPTSLGNNRWACTVTLTTDDGTIPALTDKGMWVQIYPNEGRPNIAPNEWSIWEPKLEVGSVVTPSVARPYAEELTLCQRYYQENPTNGATNVHATQYNPNNAIAEAYFTTTMRAAPTLQYVVGLGTVIGEATSDTNITWTFTVLGGQGSNFINSWKADAELS